MNTNFVRTVLVYLALCLVAIVIVLHGEGVGPRVVATVPHT